MKRLHKLYAFTCLTAVLAQPALAQDVQPEAEESAGRGGASAILGDIVVRARKKSAAERAQDVPIALAAVSGEQIEAIFAKDLTDVGQTMPNVRLDDGGAFPGVSNYTIRGMGFNSTIASVEPTVGTFVDGMYIGANLGGLMDTLDLESVEVLRGPQGTLFGRNVTGGAVSMRTRRPTGELGGVVKVSAGSGERKGIAGSIEGPLSDTLAAKVYARYSDYNGDWDNLATGKSHGALEDFVVRPIVRWKPASSVTIDLIGEYGTSDGDGVASRVIDDPTQYIYAQGVREPAGGAEKLSLNLRGDTEVDWYQAILDVNIDVGPGTLTSITGYRDVSYSSLGDTDGSEIELAHALNTMDQHQFSTELRYAGDALDGKLDYTVGFYYLTQQMEQFYHIFFFGASNSRARGTLKHHTWSVFAQADFEFVPNVFLTAGGRYTEEKKTARNVGTAGCDVDLNCLLGAPDSTNWDNFSPKVGLSWKVTPDVLVYASWTKGFRSGGYDIRNTRSQPLFPYDEETVKAWEGGIKSEFLDGRARVNIAGFHNKFSGLQRTVNQGIFNFIANVAEATVDGFEFESTFLPVESLALTANVGYLDAKYDDYVLPGTTTNLAGKQLVRAPKWTYALSATHDLDLGNAGLITSRVSYYHSGKAPANDPGDYFAPAYDLVDASITWHSAQTEGLEAAFWIKNLTNEKYALTATYVGGFFTNLYQAPPRRWGVDLTYRF